MLQPRVLLPAVSIALGLTLCILLNGPGILATASIWPAVLVHAFWYSAFFWLAASFGFAYRLRSSRVRLLLSVVAAPILLALALSWSLLLFAGAVTIESWASSQGSAAFQFVKPVVRLAIAELSLFAVAYALVLLALFTPINFSGSTTGATSPSEA